MGAIGSFQWILPTDSFQYTTLGPICQAL